MIVDWVADVLTLAAQVVDQWAGETWAGSPVISLAINNYKCNAQSKGEEMSLNT